jgi:uncharacterized protein
LEGKTVKEEKKDLKQDQISWLKDRDTCSDTECLKKKMNERFNTMLGKRPLAGTRARIRAKEKEISAAGVAALEHKYGTTALQNASLTGPSCESAGADTLRCVLDLENITCTCETRGVNQASFQGTVSKKDQISITNLKMEAVCAD